MAQTTQRAFALSLAILFTITTVGFTGYVIWQMYQESKDAKKETNTSQTQQQQQAEGCQPSSVEGEVATVPNVTLPQGDVTELSTSDVKVGDGDEVKDGDCLAVKYHGVLASDGKNFDGNFDKPTALQFELGAGQLIQGWEQGVKGMKVGGVRQINIPSNLAYGENAPSEDIPANSDLVFIVQVNEKIEQ